MTGILITVGVALASIVGLALIGRATLEEHHIPPAKADNREFPVGQHRVEYLSQGKKLVGNLFIPPDYVKGERRPGIVFGP